MWLVIYYTLKAVHKSYIPLPFKSLLKNVNLPIPEIDSYEPEAK